MIVFVDELRKVVVVQSMITNKMHHSPEHSVRSGFHSNHKVRLRRGFNHAIGCV